MTVGLTVVGFMSSSFGVLDKTELDQNIRALYSRKEAAKLLELLRDRDVITKCNKSISEFKKLAEEYGLHWWANHIEEINGNIPLLIYNLGCVLLKEPSFDSIDPKYLSGSVESRGNLSWPEISNFLSQLIGTKTITINSISDFNNMDEERKRSFGESLSTFVQQVEISGIQFGKLPELLKVLESLSTDQLNLFIKSINGLVLFTERINWLEKILYLPHDMYQYVFELEKGINLDPSAKSPEELTKFFDDREAMMEDPKYNLNLSVAKEIYPLCSIKHYNTWLNMFNILSDFINL